MIKKIIVITLILIAISYGMKRPGWDYTDHAFDNGCGIYNQSGADIKVFWYLKSGNESLNIASNVKKTISDFKGSKELPIQDDTCYISFNVGEKQLEVKVYKLDNGGVTREVYLLNGSDKKMILKDKYVSESTEGRKDYLRVTKTAIIRKDGNKTPIK